MRNTRLNSCAVALSILLSAGAMSAQRPGVSTYDSTRKVKLEGPVTRIDWTNPRAFLFVNVRDANGTILNWAVEFGAPLDLEKDGWKRSSLNVGDIVTIEGIPARGEARQASATSVILKSTGKRLFVVAPKRAAAASPAPR